MENQERPFAAEAYFFSTEEQQAILRALLEDYYRATKVEEDALDRQKTIDQSTEDFTSQQTTIDAFRAIFANRKEFTSYDAAVDFLSSATSSDDDFILEKLYAWANDSMGNLSIYGYQRVEAATPQDLLFELAPYTSTQRDLNGDPLQSVWPFVRMIRFGLKVPLLGHDITLVDLPGITDANKTRAANANKELRRCTHHMIVANIARANDDKSIRTQMAEAYGTRGSARAILVLTHADAIDESSEVHGSAKELQQVEELGAQVQALMRKRSEIGKRIASTKGAKKYDYYAANTALNIDIQAAESRYRELRIGMRSRTISSTMKDHYMKLTGDPHSLPVFCVGNEAYRKHQAGYSQAYPPNLSVEATSIPALRSHLFLAPADAKLNEMRHMVDTQIPALMKCFNLYVSKTHMARKSEIEALVTAPQEDVRRVAKDTFNDFWKKVNDKIMDFMQDQEPRWTEDAAALCKQWATLPPSQQLSFLKQNGTRNTKARGKVATTVSWNEELIYLSAAEFRFRFDEFSRDLSQVQKLVISQIARLVDDMARRIKNDPQVNIMALGPFLDYVYGEKDNIEPLVEAVFRDLRKEMGNLRSAITTDSPDNAIAKSMQPVYDDVKQMKSNAKGKYRATPKQRMSAFEKQITTVGSSVWMNAQRFLKTQLTRALQKQLDALRDEAVAYFADMVVKFNLMCATKDSDDPEEEQLRRELQKSLIKAVEMVECEVRPAADACFKKQ